MKINTVLLKRKYQCSTLFDSGNKIDILCNIMPDAPMEPIGSLSVKCRAEYENYEIENMSEH